MSTLEDIIDAPESLEFKRAVAVKMFISDFKVVSLNCCGESGRSRETPVRVSVVDR
jgi:hypothetical protein